MTKHFKIKMKRFIICVSLLLIVVQGQQQDVEIEPIGPAENATIPILFRQLWPKTTIKIGWSSSADIIVEKTSTDAFHYAFKGVADYFTYIEYSKKLKQPKTLLIEQGLYQFEKQITIRSNNTNIKGLGYTVISLTNNASNWSKPGFLRLKNVNHVKVESLVFDGNKINQKTLDKRYRNAVYIQSSENTSVNNVTIKNFEGTGLYVDTLSANIQVVKSIIKDNDINGIEFEMTNKINISNNILSNNKEYGIKGTMRSVNISITDNSIQQNICGVFLEETKMLPVYFADIDRNNLKNMSRAGICTDGVFALNIINNTISDSLSCMLLSRTNMTNIVGNICKNIIRNNNKTNVEDFINCKNCSTVFESNNTFYNDKGTNISNHSTLTKVSLSTLMLMLIILWI